MSILQSRKTDTNLLKTDPILPNAAGKLTSPNAPDDPTSTDIRSIQLSPDNPIFDDPNPLLYPTSNANDPLRPLHPHINHSNPTILHPTYTMPKPIFLYPNANLIYFSLPVSVAKLPFTLNQVWNGKCN
jgi:hypothetical protein